MILEPIYSSGEIQLVDLKGNVLKSYQIACGKNQLVINLKIFRMEFILFL